MISVHVTGRPGAVLDELADSVSGALRRGLLEAGQHQEAELRKLIFEVFPAGRTGALARSYKTRFLTKDGRTVAVGVLSSLEYARIQDQGGTIRPRTTKMLAIPLRRMPVGKWPRDFANGQLQLIKSERGNLILAKVTKRGKVTPYFVLKRAVTLRGRRYLDAAAERARPGVREIVDAHLAQSAGGAR